MLIQGFWTVASICAQLRLGVRLSANVVYEYSYVLVRKLVITARSFCDASRDLLGVAGPGCGVKLYYLLDCLD